MLTQSQGNGKLLQPMTDEYHVRCLHSQLGSFAHGYADGGLGQCRGVIDPVPYHGGGSLPVKPGDLVQFLFGPLFTDSFLFPWFLAPLPPTRPPVPPPPANFYP